MKRTLLAPCSGNQTKGFQVQQQRRAASPGDAASRAPRLEVALALVDADDLVLVDLLPRLHKQPAALLHALDRVRGHLHAHYVCHALLLASASLLCYALDRVRGHLRARAAHACHTLLLAISHA